MCSCSFSSEGSLSRLAGPRESGRPAAIPGGVFLVFVSIRFLRYCVDAGYGYPVDELTSVATAAEANDGHAAYFEVRAEPTNGYRWIHAARVGARVLGVNFLCPQLVRDVKGARVFRFRVLAL